MTVRVVVVLSALTFGWVWFGKAAGSETLPVDGDARDAISSDARTAEAARGRLRAKGPEGLEALFRVHADAIRALRSNDQGGPEEARLRGALESVARQRDVHASRLYWYTDLAAAMRAALASGKPILSLRLLGNLDEELSCANSRFFRTTLYANAAISEALRHGWILHWESVRPAPRITIDYGDGRQVVRTITGNSLHYILASDGRVVDVLPGLYGPRAFLRELERAAPVAAGTSSAAAIATYRTDVARRLGATDANGVAPLDGRALADTRVDESSRALMRAKTRGVYSEASFSRVVARFENAASEDMRRNELEFRPVILSWLGDREVRNLSPLTNRIYDELFQTPRWDPWLGLVPPETYAALDGDGRSVRPGSGVPSDEEIVRAGAPPSAMQAGALTASKMAVERPSLKAANGRPAGPVPTVRDLVARDGRPLSAPDVTNARR